ncbi:MAG: nitroreductase family protein [Promethearchaeota archaeon]
MNIVVNKGTCNRCGLCGKTCNWIEFDDEGYPRVKNEIACIDCGHCVAVCPVNALSNQRMDGNQFKTVVDPGISIEAFTHLTRNRRSTRNFKKRGVERQHLDQLLHCVRYIPTGSNKQGLEYHVVEDPRVLEEIEQFMADKFEFTYKMANIFRFMASKEDRIRLQLQINAWKERGDTYLRGAPCLLVIHTPKKYFGISAWDAGIASHNIDLAAQTLGMGTLLNGFFVSICRYFKKLKKIAGLPVSTNVFAAMLLGYPDITYKRTVARKQLKITYL